MEVSGQLHAPAALPPGKEPLVPTYKLYRDNLFLYVKNTNMANLAGYVRQIAGKGKGKSVPVLN
jgi:hypothetical protein